jgi:hypothetical protein
MSLSLPPRDTKRLVLTCVHLHHSSPIVYTPRLPEIRHLYIPRPGHVFIVSDYKYIELCTLAAVCEQRFGYSMLGRVIRAGIDPHCFTAAQYLGIDLERFMSMRTVCHTNHTHTWASDLVTDSSVI